MQLPLVSVLMPTYQRCRSGFLKRAVESVLAQDYPNFEFIVVDDGSIDGTADYLRSVAVNEPRMQVIRLSRNYGLPAYSMAVALLQSRGELLSFAFDDTELRPLHLSRLCKEMQGSDAAMVYGQTLLHTRSTTELLGQFADLNALSELNCIGNASVMIRRSAIQTVGTADPHILLKRSCDWDLWLRVFRKMPVRYLPEIVADEYGPQLPDSLCRSHHLFLKLVKRYMTLDRDAHLSPECVVAGNYDIAKVDFELDEAEQLQVDLLLLEHYIQTCNLPKIREQASHLLNSGSEDINQLWRKINAPDNEGLDQGSKLQLLATLWYSHPKDSDAHYLKEIDEYRRRLTDINAELTQLHEEHHSLQRSLSWQITRPLRELRRGWTA